mgnify:CR=1 FL=1
MTKVIYLSNTVRVSAEMGVDEKKHAAKKTRGFLTR